VGGGGGRGGERGWEAAARKRGFSIFDSREKGRCSRAGLKRRVFYLGYIPLFGFGHYSFVWR
jgi:hypothetical protein